jgi:hypothetical protein
MVIRLWIEMRYIKKFLNRRRTLRNTRKAKFSDYWLLGMRAPERRMPVRPKSAAGG